MAMTTYSMDDLKKNAQWTLERAYCREGQHKVKLAHYELRIHPDAGTSASLHIIGECKRHNYQVHHYCAI